MDQFVCRCLSFCRTSWHFKNNCCCMCDSVTLLWLRPTIAKLCTVHDTSCNDTVGSYTKFPFDHKTVWGVSTCMGNKCAFFIHTCTCVSAPRYPHLSGLLLDSVAAISLWFAFLWLQVKMLTSWLATYMYAWCCTLLWYTKSPGVTQLGYHLARHGLMLYFLAAGLNVMIDCHWQ